MKKNEKATQRTEIQLHILNNLCDKLEADKRKNHTKIASIDQLENDISICFFSVDFHQTAIPGYVQLYEDVGIELYVHANGKITMRPIESLNRRDLTGDAFERLSQYIIHICDLDENQIEVEAWIPISLHETPSFTFFKPSFDKEEDEHLALIQRDKEQNRCCNIV